MPGNGTAVPATQHQNYFSLSGAEYTLHQGTIIPSKAYLLHHQAKVVDLVDRDHTEEIYWGEKVQVSKNPEELFPNQNFSE